jgi:16S rRNA (guanine527-N7)-methyltransferase
VTPHTSDPLAELNVSRETYVVLETFAALVGRWNPAINLVGRSTIDTLWQRHVVDSAQLFGLGKATAGHWVDLGSGGGFPGLVIAAIGRDLQPEMTVTLIESDARKATFLREAVRTLGLTARIISGRIESQLPQKADVLSARALAPLPALLGFAEIHLQHNGVALFPKGQRWEEELVTARAEWCFDADSTPSISEPSAAILMIRNVKRASQT